jgi:hypothetical protein
MGRVETFLFGNDSNKWNLHSRRNREQTEVGDCLLMYDVKKFYVPVYYLETQRYKCKKKKKITCCLIGVWNLAFTSKGRTQFKGVLEQNSENV